MIMYVRTPTRTSYDTLPMNEIINVIGSPPSVTVGLCVQSQDSCNRAVRLLERVVIYIHIITLSEILIKTYGFTWVFLFCK